MQFCCFSIGSNPCEHAGKCLNTKGSFQCKCPQGYVGARCELDVNECLSSPCQNDATCLDQIGGFHCICMAGKEINRILHFLCTWWWYQCIITSDNITIIFGSMSVYMSCVWYIRKTIISDHITKLCCIFWSLSLCANWQGTRESIARSIQTSALPCPVSTMGSASTRSTTTSASAPKVSTSRPFNPWTAQKRET